MTHTHRVSGGGKKGEGEEHYSDIKRKIIYKWMGPNITLREIRKKEKNKYRMIVLR